MCHNAKYIYINKDLYKNIILSIVITEVRSEECEVGECGQETVKSSGEWSGRCKVVRRV